MKKRLKRVIRFLTYLLIIIAVLIVYSTKWSQVTYGNIQMEEILFYLTVPLQGTEKGLLVSFIKKSLIPTIIEATIINILVSILFKKMDNNHLLIKLKVFKKNIELQLNSILVKTLTILFLLVIGFLEIISCFKTLNINTYLKNQINDSTFIEENFIDSKEVKLTFPEKKRNLIYIFVESLESNYQSKTKDKEYDNAIKELYDLAHENTNFSDNDDVGGATQVSYLSWTTAGMVAQTSGIPFKVEAEITNGGQLSTMLLGDYTIGEILKEQGYNLEFMCGSDAKFGNRETFLKNHGNYDIYDYYSAIKNNKIPEDYLVWWGFEDSKLFEYAKEEITNLSKKEEPFNFSMLTANTHHIDGYVEKDCEERFSTNYDNAVACSSRQIYDFVKWIQEQDFYDNRTIVISGDHLGMDPSLYEGDDIIDLANRRVLDIIINSTKDNNNTKNRVFTTMDLFPTTLAALGVDIDGDKMALGVNLYSDKKTLLEEYGTDYVDQEFKKKSKFYNNKILKEE